MKSWLFVVEGEGEVAAVAPGSLVAAGVTRL